MMSFIISFCDLIDAISASYQICIANFPLNIFRLWQFIETLLFPPNRREIVLQNIYANAQFSNKLNYKKPITVIKNAKSFFMRIFIWKLFPV